MTTILYNEIFLKHDTGYGHPERSERLGAIIGSLTSKGFEITQSTRVATPDELALVHEKEYIQRVNELCQGGGGYLDPDTPVCSESYSAALYAVGAVLEGVDLIMEGIQKRIFCAVRPPGHHAESARGMGFCLFNNIAIGARYALKKHRIHRVLIVDFDIHHGNGTQRTFYDDPTVMYCSFHQYPFYPGTGAENERGVGEGLGMTINRPLPYGTSEEEYIQVFESTLKDSTKSFSPDIVFVSAGFDAHRDDPIGGFRLTAQGYGTITKLIVGVAESFAQGRVISLLEGGYDLGALGESVTSHVEALNP